MRPSQNKILKNQVGQLLRPDLKLKQQKITCEVFYKNNDITSLRWITEIKLFLRAYDNFVTISYHASNKNCILLESKKIDFHNFHQIITKTVMPLTSNSMT